MCVPRCPLQENQRLREQNEELNGQILSLSLHEAKNLISTQTKAQSLAAEIDNASRDQVSPQWHHSYSLVEIFRHINIYTIMMFHRERE